LTEKPLERILKRVAGKTDVEDSLKRLDILTQEEARMATAQVLKIAHSIDEIVKEVDVRVNVIDERVKDVHDKVKVAIDGVQIVYCSFSIITLTSIRVDGKGLKPIIQQTANDVDEVKRSCFLILIVLAMHAQGLSQGTSCERTFESGSLPLTRP
jgi:hypothetical protein